ncbi:MAG: hypothetical protein MJ187_02270 [Alphaproteobacteria bacterium]|nr:hypothetical protein [Alphaproteobacteria bacterium]
MKVYSKYNLTKQQIKYFILSAFALVNTSCEDLLSETVNYPDLYLQIQFKPTDWKNSALYLQNIDINDDPIISKCDSVLDCAINEPDPVKNPHGIHFLAKDFDTATPIDLVKTQIYLSYIRKHIAIKYGTRVPYALSRINGTWSIVNPTISADSIAKSDYGFDPTVISQFGFRYRPGQKTK